MFLKDHGNSIKLMWVRRLNFRLYLILGIPSLSGIFEPLAGKLVESIVKEAISKIMRKKRFVKSLCNPD